MTDRHGILDALGELLVPIHRDGHTFVAIAAGATLIAFLLWAPLGWLGACVTLFVAFFFRDPDRVVPLRDGLVISPADGKVWSIETLQPPAELAIGTEPRQRVSIRLTLLDVHVVRAPIAGRIVRSRYVPGAFLNPTLDKASEDNERRHFVIGNGGDADAAVVMIAGLVTRRLVTLAEEGADVGAGQRIGLIRFGSRVDVYLPPGYAALVAVGQRMIAGETIIADARSTDTGREARSV